MKRASTHSPRSLKFLKNLNSSIWLLCACGGAARFAAKRKGAACGPRLFFPKVLVYIFIISHLRGVNGTFFRIYSLNVVSNLSSIVYYLAIDSFLPGQLDRLAISPRTRANPGSPCGIEAMLLSRTNETRGP